MPRRGEWGLAAGLGAVLAVGVVLFARAVLVDASYPPVDAWTLSLIASQTLSLLWLPLVAVAWVDRPSGGTLHGLAGWMAATVALLLMAFVAGVTVLSVIFGQLIVLAIAAFVLAFANLPCIFRIQPVGRRMRAGVVLLLLLSNPFWTRHVMDAAGDPSTRAAVKLAIVWTAPAACLSTAWERYDYALLPQTYSTWLGPTVPYPPHPLLMTVAYLAVAGFMAGGSWLWTHRKDDADGDGITSLLPLSE